MEVSNHNVNILSVCPGFVDIGPSRVLIGAKLGQVYKLGIIIISDITSYVGCRS